MQQMTYEYARRGAYLVIVARREELLKNVRRKLWNLVPLMFAQFVQTSLMSKTASDLLMKLFDISVAVNFNFILSSFINLPLFLCSVLNLNLYLILNCFPPFLLQWIMLSIMLEFFLFSRLKT